ncbi:MAG: sugar kinase [Anaerolineales bacterium]|nr:sugar kinase [Anaerolineales bacterium]
MYEKIILVTRKTRLEGLVERFNTKAQARFYINQSAKQQGNNTDAFAFYEREHDTYYASVEKLLMSLEPLAKVQSLERSFLPNFLFAPTDLIVTIGIDGLVVNTAKYLNGQPIIAVNPDPKHVDGILLPFNVTTAPTAARQLLSGAGRVTPITMAEAKLNDGQTLFAFNDLFVGVRTHVSARYRIQWGQQAENHSSSGLIVSTGAGSTGWLSSMFNMANGMVKAFGQEDVSGAVAAPRLGWDTDRLLFVVREPFISKTSGAGIVCGAITPQTPLVLESQMPEGGVIFSDGVEADYLQFNSGAIATIGIAGKKTNLVVA